jgi:transcriptional regulator with XRE-family HTH domain
MVRDLHAARKILAMNVRRLRLARNLTQQELAARLDMRMPWVSDVETAKTNATIDNLQRLAWALGVQVSDLVKE